MKKHGWKGLVSGVVLMALLAALAVPALAVTGKKQMDVDYMNIKLAVDGVPAPVGTPFVSEGTTYLPVRAVGEALYKEVRWDGPTHTVYISDPADPNAVTTGNSVSVDKSKKTIDVDYLDIKLVVDGKEVTPKDVNGKVVEPFAYNGTTYLPVRAVGEALGKSVRWDGETKTVHLGELPQGTYLADVCKAVGSVYRAADHKAVTMYDGKRYSQGFEVGDSKCFELGGRYESLTFDLGATGSDWRGKEWNPSVSLDVYLDGKLAQEIKVTPDSGVQTVTVPLNYAQTILFDYNNKTARLQPNLMVANAVLHGEKAAPEKPVPPANATYLVDACRVSWATTYKAAEHKYFEDIFGNEYTNGIYGWASVILNGRYKTLKATVVINNNAYDYKKCKTYTFSVDGEVVGEVSLLPTTPPQTIEIPLNYGMELQIGGDYGDLFLADAYLE